MRLCVPVCECVCVCEERIHTHARTHTHTHTRRESDGKCETSENTQRVSRKKRKEKVRRVGPTDGTVSDGNCEIAKDQFSSAHM